MLKTIILQNPDVDQTFSMPLPLQAKQGCIAEEL